MRRLCVTVLALGCAASVEVPPHLDLDEPAALPRIDPVDPGELARLAAAADATPGDEPAQFRAGIEHAHAVMVGHLSYRDTAERYLQRAHALAPGESPATLILARFLNLRASVLDLSKIELQADLYRVAAAREPDAFTMRAFLQSAELLEAYGDGRVLAAFRQLKQLERDLEDRARTAQDDVDTHAMAGNFALTWAGVIGVGSRRRLDDGTAYLEVQQARWDELSPGARDVGIAPGVQSVFTLALAEGHLAAARTDEARAVYKRLLELDVPHTRARAQIEAVARHRLDHLDAYAGDRDLLPPWPHGPSGCIACHARTTELPATGLHTLDGATPW